MPENFYIVSSDERIALIQDALLAEILGSKTLVPIENSGEFKTHRSEVLRANQVMKMNTASEIEGVTTFLERQALQVKQLREGLVTARTKLKKCRTSKKTRADAAEKAAKERRRQRETQELQAKAAEAERSLRSARQSRLFSLSWPQSGLVTYKTDAEWEKALGAASGDVFEVPCVVRSSATVRFLAAVRAGGAEQQEVGGGSAASAAEGGAEEGLLKMWEGALGWRRDAKTRSLESAQHRVTGEQGLAKFKELLSTLIPEEKRVIEVATVAAQSEMDAVYLTGYSSTFMRSDYSSFFLGTCRVVTEGGVQVQTVTVQ